MAKILIVDDHPINRQFLMKLVGYVGHQAIEAADGVEGLKIAQAENPDLVITDICMPRMTGDELVQKMRATQDLVNTPVVFYTASYRVQEASALGKDCGVTHILHKPAKPADILQVLKEVLQAQTPPTEPRGAWIPCFSAALA